MTLRRTGGYAAARMTRQRAGYAGKSAGLASRYGVRGNIMCAVFDNEQWRLYQMQLADLDQLMAIESYSFPTPWKREMYEQDLLNNTYSRFYVIKHVVTGELAAYIGSWFIYEEAHVGTIATKRDYRGCRLAEQLLAYSALQAENEGLTYMILEVRVSNTSAIRLYERLGFTQVGLRKGYYTDTGEDASLMTCDNLASLSARLVIAEG
jgi:ribosomal-protein-alanine N-acetyltransferase